jgi:phage baseplate assembly protein W
MTGMIIDTSEDSINWNPASEDEEIYQNCKTILKTVRSTCPLHREFGLSIKSVDLPQPQALASLSQDIVTTFGKYEPRVKVIEIIPLSNNGDGQLPVKVKVRKV